MKTNEEHPGAHRCSCCNSTTSPRRTVLNRRGFLAVSSGCLIGALGVRAADKPATIDIGKPADFPEDGIFDTFTKDGFFVIRRESRLIATSTKCPHQGNTLRRDPDDSSRIICGGHESAFDAEGKVLVGPASTGLIRLRIALNDKGRILVTPRDEFPQENWSDENCFLELK